MSKNTGTIGMPVIQSKLLLSHISRRIMGIMIIAKKKATTKIRKIIRMINLIRRPSIRSEAVERAVKGRNPGAVTATRAISELESQYPERINMSEANTK